MGDSTLQSLFRCLPVLAMGTTASLYLQVAPDAWQVILLPLLV